MAAADRNSDEKFAQPGGAKFRDFKEQKRRRLCGIYRGIFVARGQRNLSGIERENWDISQPVPTRTRNRLHAEVEDDCGSQQPLVEKKKMKE
jgi:hypothetical protein